MATKRKHPPFPALLDHGAGRDDPAVAAHLAACAGCGQRAAAARRLVEAGRRAATAPRLTRRALRRAEKIFRDAQAQPRPGLLRLVLDSLLQPAPAVRSATAAPSRFLRFEGDVTVELQITGREIRGALTPPGYAVEVVLQAGTARRRAAVEADGSFMFRRVPKGRLELRVGASRITGLEV